MADTRSVYHPEIGHFEAVGDGPLPDGSTVLPPCPSANHRWNGSEWVYEAPTIAPELVKAEAARRILEVAPEWKQRNLTAQAAQLAAKGRENWAPEEQAAWDAGMELWQRIAAIRAASDLIEADKPINTNFETDERWP